MGILEQIDRDEGTVLHLYYDDHGIPTIGQGWNLRDVRVPADIAPLITLPRSAALELTRRKLAENREWLEKLEAWPTLSDARRGVLENMAFNLGEKGLFEFVHFLAALNQGDYKRAAAEIRDSHLAPARRERLARQMETDTWI